jgi:hypothetical protein
LQVASTKLLQEHLEGLTERRLVAKGIDPTKPMDEKVRKHLAGEPNEKTQGRYRRTGNRLLDGCPAREDVWTWTAERKSSSKGTWYDNRASLQFALRERIRHAKHEIDECVRAVNAKSATQEIVDRARKAIEVLSRSAEQLKRMPQGGVPASLKSVGGKKTPRRTKGRSLKGLPENWRELVAEQMPERRRKEWLVQCMTGIRPAELAKGVRVKFEAGKVMFLILGAKVREGLSGQDKRILEFDDTSSLARMLAEALEHKPCTVGADTQAESYRKSAEYYGRKAFPNRKGELAISAYTARHAFKTQLKAAGKTQQDIAMAMGHRSTKSASYYCGTPKGKKGAVVPVAVKATHMPKVRKHYVKPSVVKANPRPAPKMKPPGFE